ncbi:hypothetical protein FF100_27420 [Methylobacterium terricola]|uniref:Uncharacterized protein n=1 Tax=Methylobacterium terricola TaxID=2583531 RepID=A0A5C4LA24_9HYPH|nr:hypothetical protein [Methylobacterium terricola]TNC09038.1 hypothetical protein FF100_27420 [Methylobacterium terricola]
MMSIEDVHRLLEVTEDALSLLGQWRHEKIDVGDIGDFCLAVAEILEWQTAYSDASVRLGVAANILTRYAKFRGPFQAREATVVAQRIRSFLKSQDQASVMPSQVSAQTPEQQQARKPEPIEQSKFAFQADGWISIQNDVHVKQKIMAVSVLLDSIIEQISHSNNRRTSELLALSSGHSSLPYWRRC